VNKLPPSPGPPDRRSRPQRDAYSCARTKGVRITSLTSLPFLVNGCEMPSLSHRELLLRFVLSGC